MKKILKLFVAIIVCIMTSIGLCACKTESDKTLSIYMPDGAPALAMSKLMYDNNDFGYDVDYNVVASNNIANCVITNTADIAILPINAASKILKDGENYKIVATVTNGNLYIVGNQDIGSLADLKGKVIGVIGRGNVPDLNLKCLLTENKIEYEEVDDITDAIDGKVAIKYYNDASNLLPTLKKNELNFGLIPEPAVSKLLSMATNFNVEFDMQALWEGGSYPQAVMVAKTSLCDDTKLLNDILSEMKDGESWIVNNPSLAVDAVNCNLVEGVTASLQNTITAIAIANCNIRVVSTAVDGEISRMKFYLEKIRSIASSAIGNYTDNLFCEL